MLQPTVRRTWAPKGQTPIHYSWDRRDRISVISAVTVSPKCRRLGLYFELCRHNIKADDVETFIIQLLGRLHRPIIVVMDRWQVHRCAARRLLAGQLRNLYIEWLPAYAPDLNPVEGVWDRTKYGDLANFIPDDVAHLKYAVRKSLRHTRAEQSVLRSLFHYAQLKL